MNKVNLFIIGAAKSGTTSLLYYLSEIDGFCFPRNKEQNFFSLGTSNVPGNGSKDKLATYQAKNLNTYESNYHLCLRKKVKYLCDASVAYLYDDYAAPAIYQYNPQAKIIVILRNPIERAWSHYWHLKRDCREELEFYDALLAEENRIKEGWEFSWHYKNMGIYSEQVSRYLEIFPRENIEVLLFNDLKKDINIIFNRLANFLIIDEIKKIKPNNKIHNSTGKIKSKLLASIVNKPGLIRNLIKSTVPRHFGHNAMEFLRTINMEKKKPEIDECSYRYLSHYYKDEIINLNKLLNIDVTHWIADYDSR